MPRIVILSGSISASSRINGVLDYAGKVLSEAGLQVDFVNVRDLPPEDLLSARFDSTAIVQANRLIEQADAVVVATPVYKASYTGVLKAYLDLLPQKGLADKVILPLAVGGTLSHLLMLDYALKPVLAALGAEHVLSGVYAVDSQIQRDDPQGVVISEEIVQRLDRSLDKLIQLAGKDR
ncbi:NADPH-dependent FMN reductase [Brevibacillus sp. B_LB10_24]|jgi:FMN reductase|uniref:NADPH-dependent FMN reductase n=1 Tax=Brevibacillus sp. B_LB10_24 TaxID=3380645 RepID=UPI0038BAD49C